MSFPLDAFLPHGLGIASMSSARRMASSHPSAAALRIKENESSIQLRMDLPGVRAKDVEVTVQHGVLAIRGCRVERGMDGKICKKQKLAQRFSVDTHVVDVTKAVANLSHGVLVIHAPKKSRPVAVKIPVTDCDELVLDETYPSTTGAATKNDTKKNSNAEGDETRVNEQGIENHVIQPEAVAAESGE